MNIKLIVVFCIIITFYCFPLQCKSLGGANKDDSNDDEELIESEYQGLLTRKTIENLRKCDQDMETMELCMRCAKITKSTIVYPLCCGNEDNVKGWCHDYVYYAT